MPIRWKLLDGGGAKGQPQVDGAGAVRDQGGEDMVGWLSMDWWMVTGVMVDLICVAPILAGVNLDARLGETLSSSSLAKQSCCTSRFVILCNSHRVSLNSHAARPDYFNQRGL